jgi:lantibiotic modifying enzyme
LEHGEWLAEREELNEVLYGRAGFLLALLALHRSFPNARLRELADTTAQAVIRGARVRDGAAFWPGPHGKHMPNPSHGSSGVAMALARWAALSGDDRAGHLALMALRHDDSFWVEPERGWADGRFQDVELPERTNWSWCNGRSGGLLSRLAVSEALHTPFATETVERALNAAGSDILTDVSPGLCCGTAGAVDALFEVCRRHGHDTLAEQGVRAAEAMARSSPRNHYLMLSGSLFTGTAGLALGFLRAACPERVESILWFG